MPGTLPIYLKNSIKLTWEKIFAVGATLLSTILYNIANNLSSGKSFGPRR